MPERARSNLSRIVGILAQFDGANTPRGSAEILAQAGMTRATGYALIRALVARGWLARVDHGLLRLGPRAAELMYGPLEPALALDEAPMRLAALPTLAREEPTGLAAVDPWRSDLVELVDTTRFARPGKVRVGFANASLSNPWRAALLASMRYAHRLNEDRFAGFDIRTADDDPDTQIAQIDDMVRAGIDILIVSCPNVTNRALNDRLMALAAAGLPIVALDRRPSDPSCLVSFVTASDSRIGRVTAQWIAEHLRGPARVWLLSGVEGASPAIRRQAAALTVFSAAAHITVEAVAFSDWTEAGGHAAIDRLLEQAGHAPDAVWADSGLQGVGSLRRFLERGGPLPIHSGGDLNRMYKMALMHKLPFVAVDYPAAMGARAIEMALDVLAGKPVRRRVEIAAPVVLPRGHETPSVRADIWAETHVRWDLPDDAILSQGPSLARQRDARAARSTSDDPDGV
jgi:ribose transport system substrate-binding protein